MSSTSRLLRIFKAKASTSRKSPLPINPYGTPEGLRNVVDYFKNSCRNKRFRRKESIYEGVVNRLAKVEAFPLIEEIIDSQKRYKEISSEGFVIRLISLYGKAGMFDNALSLFDEMPSFNCPRTVRSFAAVINAAINSNRFDDALRLFRTLPSMYSIQPDIVLFNIAIRAFCLRDSLDEALAMIREMEEHGIKPDVITFNTLLSAFYEKRGILEGEKFWERNDFDHDVVSYLLKMCAMVRDGRVTEAAKLVDEMRLKGIEPNVHCFNALIKAFCHDGSLKGVKYWYDEMRRSQCAADRVTYTTLVPFLLEKGCLDLALQLCKEAINGTGRSIINVRVLKLAVEKFVAEGMMEQAKQLVQLAKKKKKLEIELPSNLS